MKGRKQIPDEIKKLKGTAQPCRLRPDALKVKDLVNLPTAHKSLKGEAKDIYEDVGHKLLSIGILNSVNIGNFVVYCYLMGRVSKLATLLNDVNDVDDMAKVQKMHSDTVKNARMLAVEFGLTPSSSGKVHMPKQETKSPFETFMNGK